MNGPFNFTNWPEPVLNRHRSPSMADRWEQELPRNWLPYAYRDWETPYYTLPSIIGNYAPIYPVERMIHFKIPTWKYLQDVTAPVLILHGTNDWTIPLRNAEKLKPFLKKNDQFKIIEGGHHNDLWNFEETKKLILGFLPE